MTARPRVFSNARGWKTVDGKEFYFKSTWEYRYALHLDYLKKIGYVLSWEYEPKTFLFEKIKSGTRTYKPDFLVNFASGLRSWVEVKGFMDARSKTQISRFKRFFPDEPIKIIDREWFKKFNFIKEVRV